MGTIARLLKGWLSLCQQTLGTSEGWSNILGLVTVKSFVFLVLLEEAKLEECLLELRKTGCLEGHGAGATSVISGETRPACREPAGRGHRKLTLPGPACLPAKPLFGESN